MIPREVIDDILSKADIVQIIGSYINLVKRGNNYWALCPFHNDRHPSLSVSPSKQIYSCFVCHEGGNVFTFVQNYEKISYIDAVKKVAKMIGYSSPSLNVEQRRVDDATKGILSCLKDANEFYHYVVFTEAGKHGYDYLQSRNIDNEMINYFSLGFSPDNGDITIRQLRGKNHSVDEIDQSGILIRNVNTFSDRFQGRITFPIYNEYSEVIGFSARKIDNSSDDAKFINSPATKVFNKSAILYNYQNASKEARREGYIYIVEGFMDVFAFYRAGIKSCIALMGTAFTSEHAKILRRLNVPLRLCLDGDDAGQHGILLMTKILDEYHISYQIVDYHGDKRDPDDIFNQDGKEKFITLVSKLIKKNDFLINYFTNRHDLSSIDGKKDFLDDVIKNYSSFSDDIEKKLFLSQVSSLVNLDISSLKELFKDKKVDDAFAFGDFKIKKQRLTKIENSEQHLIRYMLQSMEAVEYIKESSIPVFIDDIYNLLAKYIIEYKSEKPDIDIKDLINLIQQTGGEKKMINLLISISEMKDMSPYSRKSADEYIDVIQKNLSDKEFLNQFEDAGKKQDPLLQAKLLDMRIKKKRQ